MRNNIKAISLIRVLFQFRSPVAAVFDEIFSIEIGDNPNDLKNKVAEKMQSMLKIFNVDRLWSAAIVHDRILKTIQVRHSLVIIVANFSDYKT